MKLVPSLRGLYGEHLPWWADTLPAAPPLPGMLALYRQVAQPLWGYRYRQDELVMEDILQHLKAKEARYWTELHGPKLTNRLPVMVILQDPMTARRQFVVRSTQSGKTQASFLETLRLMDEIQRVSRAISRAARADAAHLRTL